MERLGFSHRPFLSLGAVRLGERKGINEKHLPAVAGTLLTVSLAPFHPILSDVKTSFKDALACLYLLLNNSYSLALRPPHSTYKVGPCLHLHASPSDFFFSCTCKAYCVLDAVVNT